MPASSSERWLSASLFVVCRFADTIRSSNVYVAFIATYRVLNTMLVVGARSVVGAPRRIGKRILVSEARLQFDRCETVVSLSRGNRRGPCTLVWVLVL